MRHRLIIFAVAFIASASSALSYDLDSHEKQIVRDGFAGDPRFGELKAAEMDGNVLVCGKVNAKNQFGQYMGETIFSGALIGKSNDAATFIILNAGINPTDEEANELLCRKHGISF